MPMNTIRQLAAITDAALFERIATSVLRSADSKLYSNLSHQGVNTDGKTIKAPLDNVGWISRVNGENMLVAAAHTTSSRDDLAGKWLHDPSTVIPRKKGGKPTQPQGDLVKAIEEINQLRKTYPKLNATLALTCNREEPADVRIKAQTLADAANITLDIWSVSRLAQYLDTTADGQSIRHEYLGTPVTLLSKAELIRAGKMSLDARTLPTSTNQFVSRNGQLSGTGHVVLSGASGMGKSTLCLELLRTALENGNAGLVISEHTLQDAVSLEEAIDTELRRFLPYLEPIVGGKALALCNEFEPLIIVIEDISRAQNTEVLLRKVVEWALSSIAQVSLHRKCNWRLLCPIWPRFLLTLEKLKEAQKAGIIHSIGLYTDKEATEAVKLRGEALGKPLSDISAKEIAQTLGRDPLLIGLHEFTGTGYSQDVIGEYMEREFARIALPSGFTVSDVECTVGRLGFQMLQHKCLRVTWGDAMCWLERDDDKKILRELVGKSGILRLARSNGKEIIEIRHDRVLHSMLASSIAARLNLDLTDPFLADPYFAEQVGTALVLSKMSVSNMQKLINDSPLIVFYALKDALVNNFSYVKVLYDVIVNWLSLTETLSPHFASRRLNALRILSEIDSPVVLELTDRFPDSDRFDTFYQARFRNGDFSAGISLLTLHSMDVSVSGRNELIGYVLERNRDELVCYVERILTSTNCSQREIQGSLYLAGYLADSKLASAVRIAWSNVKPPERNLALFLWAAAHVCGNEATMTLGPICDAWAALPEPDNQTTFTLTRSSLAAHGLSWRFQEHPPVCALNYFLSRARHDDLKWPITYMLRGVDNPLVLTYLSEYLADLSRHSKNGIGFAASFVTDEWRRLSEERGRPMSTESKESLVSLALEPNNDKHLRQQSFKLWETSISPNDIFIVQKIKSDDILYDIALWARARRLDASVISEIVVKIKSGNSGYWWQVGRYIWSDELTELLDESLGVLCDLPEEEHDNLGGWIFPELLLRLDVIVAQDIIIKNWNKVKVFPQYVQVALFLATPKLIDLVNHAITSTLDKKIIFQHFSMNVGLRSSEGIGITRESQLKALQPYLALLSESDLYALWEECKSKNWNQFCYEHLEPLLVASALKSNFQFRTVPPYDLSDLENALIGRSTFISLWLNIQIRRGAVRELLFMELLSWAREKGDLNALSIVGDIYSNEATRSEFEGFKNVSSIIPGGEVILNRVRFNIFNRTLI
ncbi:hypothetical protein [Enterobacter roggenkampii]|uniref:hypothetical protein n=1 Tax=Enterobacter roggenkampii TaxID=1812935 RepID=UPI003CEDC2B1